MTGRLSAIDRQAGVALAVLFAALALYGCWSLPELVARWGMSPVDVALFGGWLGVAAWCLSGAVRAPSRLGWAMFATVAVAMRLAVWRW